MFGNRFANFINCVQLVRPKIITDISVYIVLVWSFIHSFIHPTQIPYSGPSTKTRVAPVLIAPSFCWETETEGHHLDEGVANFFYKGPERKYFQLQGPQCGCYNF